MNESVSLRRVSGRSISGFCALKLQQPFGEFGQFEEMPGFLDPSSWRFGLVSLGFLM
jgi:hypothetical protein